MPNLLLSSTIHIHIYTYKPTPSFLSLNLPSITSMASSSSSSSSSCYKGQRILLLPLIFLTASVWCLLATPSAAGELRQLHHHPKADKSVRFIVVGDWGREGSYNQTLVAHQMGIVGEKLDIDFVISTGDNFYENGLKGVNDSAFYDSFVNIYTSPSLHKPWYSVLGNHDYRGDVEAQLSPILRHKDCRWICMRSFILNAEIVDLFFVDTTPFRDAYFMDPGENTYDWSGVLPRQAYLSNLLKEVDSALKNSKAAWKLVIGHHTIKSAGQHGNTQELEAQLVPILEANGVDAYINGHDHCLEHIIDSESGIQYLTSGGGSKAWRGDVKTWKPEELKLYYDGQGFLSVQINQSKAYLVFYDVFGKVLHEWTISKNLDLSA